MKTINLRPVSRLALMSGVMLLNLKLARAQIVDPRTNRWLETHSGEYARIYTNDAMKTAGTTLSTWSNGLQTQSAPAYCGVQEVDSSSNWVYFWSTGLVAYNMGPWLNGAFPNLPGESMPALPVSAHQ